MGVDRYAIGTLYSVRIEWTETQYNLCNEAPAKFCTSAPVPTIPGSAFAKPWIGRGGGGGPLVAQA